MHEDLKRFGMTFFAWHGRPRAPRPCRSARQEKACSRVWHSDGNHDRSQVVRTESEETIIIPPYCASSIFNNKRPKFASSRCAFRRLGVSQQTNKKCSDATHASPPTQPILNQSTGSRQCYHQVSTRSTESGIAMRHPCLSTETAHSISSPLCIRTTVGSSNRVVRQGRVPGVPSCSRR